jgi:hypothetical protein
MEMENGDDDDPVGWYKYSNKLTTTEGEEREKRYG